MKRLDDLDAAKYSLDSAWELVHAAALAGWFVGCPGQRHGGQSGMYAFNTREKCPHRPAEPRMDGGRSDGGDYMPTGCPGA